MILASETECVSCGRVPKRSREAHRLTIECLPLHEPVCLKCWEALGENFGWFKPQTTMH